MDNRKVRDLRQQFEDDDRSALDGLANAPPNRKKTHSYSQQLRSNTGTNHKKRHLQLRKHSLDDNISVPKSISSSYYQYDANNNSNSSSEEEFYPYSTTTPTTISPMTTRISSGGECSDHDHDYNYNYLSQKIDDVVVVSGTNMGDQSQPLPEFAGNGGGTGIFKVPSRAAVHPGRPTCLELRPHPLRETQVGKFLRTMACTETQLWAGQETGVRVWNFSDAYAPGMGLGARARRGDEDASPFYESTNTPPTITLLVDPASKLVWTGHKDGKIRSWKIFQSQPEDTPFKEGLSWQAHRGPVLSMAFSSYGDLWSGSEGGIIKVWPWEAIEKSLALSPEERHMAALLVERSSIDLRSQVTINGVCNISASDVKYMISDNVRAKMWAAGSLSFSLWDARSRELLRVFNVEGQTENRVDVSSVQDQSIEDEVNVKFVSKSKKEKKEGSSFLQRSRNALMGAADAVRRAAKGAGAFVDDNKKTEALVLAADGMIWTGCSNGLLVQWDGNGNRQQDFNHHPCAVLCFCAYGSRIWVGYVSGMVQVLDLEGNLLAGWIAHNGPVVKLSAGNGYVFSLATHGGIRGWGVSSPGPIDDNLRQELAEREHLFTGQENIKLLVGTWNVGQGRASQDALMSWIGSVASDVGIVVIGLQEVEMGAGFLAMSAAKETVGLEGSSIGQWWQDTIGKTLDEGTTFERVGSRQLAGLLISIWVRKTVRTYVGDLDVSAVACGLGRAIGNKGGVGLRLRVYDRLMCFTNCHFAAHLEAVNRRNADFDHIFRTMSFARSSTHVSNAAVGVSSNAQMLRGANAVASNVEDARRPDLAEADLVIFCGDFNYRLFGISYDEARDFVSQRSFDWLREKDQLRAEMKAGKVFQGMREALIRFPPTYKFERGKAGLGGYDSGEKKRIPAWCDRILYRDNRASPSEVCSLKCPVVCSILQYEACMEVTESDHKPVRCKFNVEVAHVDRSMRRQEFGKIMQSNRNIRMALEDIRYVPDIFVSTNKIILQNQDTYKLRITNRCDEDNAFFQFICEGQSTIKEDEQASEYRPRGSFGFPRWLEVTPAAGVIKPNQVSEISVHHEEFHTLEEFVDGIPQSWWSEDTRDKEVILLINVKGNCSTETRTHRIVVRHRFSATTIRIDSKGTNSRRHEGSSHHRSSNEGSSHHRSSNEGSSHHRSSRHSSSINSSDESRSLRGGS